MYMGQNEWDEDEDEDEEEVEDNAEWDEDEDEDFNEHGETEDEERQRLDHMDEMYPDRWQDEEVSDSEKLSMMESDECSECGGIIDKELDATEENVVACNSCGKEHIYCSTCPGYYDAFLMECPNDHS